MKSLMILILVGGLAPAAASPVFDPADAVSASILATATGKADLAQLSIANQENNVAGNSVIGNSTTGAVSIDGNAFQNLNGLAVINANSGNNVAINSSLNVNVAILPR